MDGCPFANGANAEVFASEKAVFSGCGTSVYADGSSGFFHSRTQGRLGYAYHYGSKGNLLYFSQWEYDSEGNCIKETRYNDKGRVTESIEWGYDNGMLVEEIQYNASGAVTYSYGCEYDSKGDLWIEYTHLNNKQIKITKYHGKEATVEIPSKIRGYAVTVLGGFSFAGCNTLTSVTIPDSVTTLEGEVFQECKNLSRVIMGNGVKSIGRYAFLNCPIQNYTVYDNAKYIGNKTNPYAVLLKATSEKITSCKVHKDTKVILDNSFWGCKSLTDITIPNGVTNIGEAAFAYCDSLTEVPIPSSVTIMGDCVFHDCRSLRSITIPDGVTELGYAMFQSCTNLESINIPDSVTSIGDDAFVWCSNLTSITIPAGVTYIDETAFYRCDNLRTVYFSSEAQKEKFKHLFPNSDLIVR